MEVEQNTPRQYTFYDNMDDTSRKNTAATQLFFGGWRLSWKIYG